MRGNRGHAGPADSVNGRQRPKPSIPQGIGRVIERLQSKGDIAILLWEQYFECTHEWADRFVALKRGEGPPRPSTPARQHGCEAVRQVLAV